MRPGWATGFNRRDRFFSSCTLRNGVNRMYASGGDFPLRCNFPRVLGAQPPIWVDYTDTYNFDAPSPGFRKVGSAQVVRMCPKINNEFSGIVGRRWTASPPTFTCNPIGTSHVCALSAMRGNNTVSIPPEVTINKLRVEVCRV